MLFKLSENNSICSDMLFKLSENNSICSDMLFKLSENTVFVAICCLTKWK